MTLRLVLLIVTLGIGILTGLPAIAAAPPKVVASIAPIHSLAAGVMADIGVPDLLVQGYGSPHVYQMRPSEARTLSAADIVLWIGEPLETFLVGPIRNLSGNARVVSLLEVDGLDLHLARTSSLWGGKHDHDDDRGSTDPHIWLSPRNAKTIVDAISSILSAVDPGREKLYAANGAAVKKRIDRLDVQIQAALSDVVDVPFVVFHDFLLYFQVAFDLTVVGAVTLDPSRQPGAGSLRALKRHIADSDARCILVEPQFTPTLVETLAEGTTLTRAVVDPVGTDFPFGPNAYFEMMNSNADNLARCLEPVNRHNHTGD